MPAFGKLRIMSARESEALRPAVLQVIESIAPDADLRALRADLPLRDQVELDSLDWINVLAGLRDRFSISIPVADEGRLRTLDDLVRYVDARQREGRHAASVPAPAPDSDAGRQFLVNGELVAIRPIRADDKEIESDFVRRLSPETRYERFMVTLSELPPKKLRYLTEVDQVRHVALVAIVERPAGPSEIGVVRYVVDDSGEACEFAVAIDDAWQGSGLGGLLMQRLIDIARARGLARMEGLVLATNARMLKFTRQLGFRVVRDPEDRDTVRVVREFRAAS